MYFLALPYRGPTKPSAWMRHANEEKAGALDT